MSDEIDVLFPVMPFVHADQPSLACELLASTLREAGFRSEVRYYTLRACDDLGFDLYKKIANGYPRNEMLLGELLFSQLLNDSDAGPLLEAMAGDAIDKAPDDVEFFRGLARLRPYLATFVSTIAQEIAAARPAMVAISSTFQQHCAGLALARSLRRIGCDSVLVMGGANCEGMMGLQTARSFPFLDAVVSGPGEKAIIELVSARLARRPVAPMKGLFVASDPAVAERGPEFAPEPSMASLPDPDYSAFFDQLDAHPGLARNGITLPIETARGCWWGEKNHCSFCGLNGNTMTFRHRPVERTLSLLRHLRSERREARIMVVDNIISMTYFRDLLPALEREALGPLFFEVKANLTRHQVAALGRAGINEIQPGIESFSDAILKRMVKGVSAIQNVLLLRMCAEEGVQAGWNVLYGLPGETAEDYRVQLDIIAAIPHLQPPASFGRARIDRFSPLYDMLRGEQGGVLHPEPVYWYIYHGKDPAEVMNLAYYFTADYPERDAHGDERASLEAALRHWQDDHPRACLALTGEGNEVALVDSRDAGEPVVEPLDPIEARFWVEAAELRRWDDLGRLAERLFGSRGADVLARMVALRRIVRIGGGAVSLVMVGLPPDDVAGRLEARRARTRADRQRAGALVA